MKRLKKGDKVVVIKGKDKGKFGNILEVVRKKNKVIVENINVVKKHTKPTQQSKGGIIDMAAPLAASNVMPLAPGTDNGTRVSFGQSKDKKVREAKRNGKVLA